METSTEDVILQTKSWIKQVVIDLNFCPFAAKPFKDDAIHYKMIEHSKLNLILEELIKECNRLEIDKTTDTTLLILTNGWTDFTRYLDLIDLAEKLIKKEGYEGVYQIASFHPQYLFAGSKENDASNYTNRSPYPMLHILREDQIEKAVNRHKDINGIPQTNIAKANELGLAYFKGLKFS